MFIFCSFLLDNELNNSINYQNDMKRTHIIKEAYEFLQERVIRGAAGAQKAYSYNGCTDRRT